MIDLAAGPSALTFAADVIVLATAVLAAALLLALAGPRQPAWRHTVLRSALVLVALSPLGVWAASSSELPRQWSSALQTTAQAPAAFRTASAPIERLPRTGPAILPERAVHAPPPARSDSGPVLLGIAVWIWCAGAGFGLLRLLYGARAITRLRRESTPALDPAWVRAKSEAQRALGVRRLPVLCTSAVSRVPMAVGLLRPSVVVPARLSALDVNSLRDVLIHEYAHVLRRDAWTGLLQRWVAIALWPHPLLHIANRELVRAREELCDNHVLRVSDGVAFSRTLLDVARGRGSATAPAHALTLFRPRWSLERRVAGLLDNRRRTMTRLRRLPSILALSVLGVTALTVSAAHTFQPVTQEAANAPDISGVWDGGEWGTVTIRGEVAVYTATWNGAPGSILFGRTGRRAFSGFWSESELHGGTLELAVAKDDRTLLGSYRIHERARHRPGAKGAVKWTFVRAAEPPPPAPPAFPPVDRRGESGQISPAIYPDGSTPEAAQSFYEKALGIYNEGRLAEAGEMFERALRLDPTDSRAHRALSRLALETGDYDRAETLLNRALDLSRGLGDDSDPATAETLMNLASIYEGTERYEMAAKCYEVALENRERLLGTDHPDTSDTRHDYARVLATRGMYQQAQSLQRQALEGYVRIGDTAKTVRALRELARLSLSLGDVDRAQAYQSRANELDAQDPQVVGER